MLSRRKINQLPHLKQVTMQFSGNDEENEGKKDTKTSSCIMSTRTVMSKRESLAWILALVQCFVLVLLAFRKLTFFNQFPVRQHNNMLMKTEVVPDNDYIKKVWHGGTPEGSPLRGTCWCGGNDGYCMCNPSLAIDVVLTSGSDHIWLVKRKDTGQFATMGGFVDVGESVETAVARELKEETGLTLKSPPILLGVYSDPNRDSRRHIASAAYIANVPPEDHPNAGDDAKDVQRVLLHTAISSLDLYADHRTILMDYQRLSSSLSAKSDNNNIDVTNSLGSEVLKKSESVIRSVCSSVQ